MTRVPLNAPRAAPGTVALRTAERRHVGAALAMAWIVVAGAVGVALVGAQHPAVALGPTQPVAVAAAVFDPILLDSDSSLPIPHDPFASSRFPGTLTTTLQVQPIPAFVGLDDPPGVGPPPPVDPAVARLLAQLQVEAKGKKTDVRPAAQALVALDFALAQVGVPYVWGATGPDSYDCSGLTWHSYAHAGIVLPRVSAAQHALGGPSVAIADLLPGDLVFFATAAWDPGAVHHVGMYVGRGLMVDAPHPGAYVRVEPVWAAGYVGAIRVVPALGGADANDHKPSPSATPTPTPSGPTATPADPSTPSGTPSTTDPGRPSSTPTPTDPGSPPASDPTTPPASDPTPDPTTPPPSTDPSPDPSPSPDPPTDPATSPPADPPASSPPPPASSPAGSPSGTANGAAPSTPAASGGPTPPIG